MDLITEGAESFISEVSEVTFETVEIEVTESTHIEIPLGIIVLVGSVGAIALFYLWRNR